MKCPCHSGKEYAECCESYHKGELPPSPLALMRSRYSAYALGNVEYILATTYPEIPQQREQIIYFCQHTIFKGLEILETKADTVTFRASLEQHGKDTSFAEKSTFIKKNGRWLYCHPNC